MQVNCRQKADMLDRELLSPGLDVGALQVQTTRSASDACRMSMRRCCFHAARLNPVSETTVCFGNYSRFRNYISETTPVSETNRNYVRFRNYVSGFRSYTRFRNYARFRKTTFQQLCACFRFQKLRFRNYTIRSIIAFQNNYVLDCFTNYVCFRNQASETTCLSETTSATLRGFLLLA